MRVKINAKERKGGKTKVLWLLGALVEFDEKL